MIGMNNPTLPPAPLSDDALRLAATLLQIASDPSAAKARLDELSTATQGLRDAIAQHEATAAKAEAATTALSDVERRAQELASREDALIASQTRLNVSAGAIADRDEALKSKEAAHAQREADLAKRVAELDRRVESYRAALAG